VDSGHIFVTGGGDETKQTYYITYPDFEIEVLDDWPGDVMEMVNCGLIVTPEGKR